MTSDLIEIYTDGACNGNPGPGGWGAILRFGDAGKGNVRRRSETTNNRMELMAVIEAFEALEPLARRSCTPTRNMCKKASASGFMTGNERLDHRRQDSR